MNGNVNLVIHTSMTLITVNMMLTFLTSVKTEHLDFSWSWKITLLMNRNHIHDEINNAVQELKLNNLPVEDTIPNEIIKPKPVVCILYKLFHFCFANSIVPTAWLKGVITPIPKSTFKDPCMPLNYRGITLLSCMSKVYTKVLNKKIIFYVEEGNILVEEQSGFRAHRSCLDNLFSLTSIISNKTQLENTFMPHF